MATSQTSTVTKIYDLQVIGFADVDKQLKAITKDFQDVKKAKEDLAKASGSSTSTSKELDDINKRLQDQAVRQKELTLAIKEQTEARQRLKLAAEQEKTQAAGGAQQIAQDNSIKQAREDNKALRAERDLLNTADAEGKARVDELNTSIDKNNQLIRENVDVLTKQKINVGNYEGSAKLIVDALKKVEAEITTLSTKQQGLRDLQARDPIGFKLAGGEENLNKTTQALAGVTKEAQALNRITEQPQFLNIAAKVADSNSEIRFFTKALVDLENSGEKNTQVYQDLEARIAKLAQTLRETKEGVKALSSETRGLDLVASGFKSVADGAQLFVGAQALFGKSNEDVQRSLQTLLAVQNLATAARSIADDATKRGTLINKAYTFVLAQINTLNNANASSSAKWLSALKLGGIGAVIALVGILIANLDKLNGKQKELADGLKGLQGVNADTVESLKAMGKTIDEVADKSTENLKAAIKSLNDELGNTPTLVQDTEASLQLLNNRVGKLVDDLNNNQFSFLKFLQGIGGAQANFGTLKELAETGDKIKENTELLKKFKELQAQSQTKAGVISTVQDDIRAADLQVDANNRILANEKSTLDQKLTALRSNLTERRKIINDNLSIELINAGKDATKHKEAVAKAHLDTVKAERDFQDQILAAQKSGAEKSLADSLSRIDALRDELLAKEKTRVAQQKIDHDLSFDEEVAFLLNVQTIEEEALNAKIRVFRAQKDLNAQELAQLAGFQQDKAELELKTAQDIQKLRDDEFKRRSEQLKQQAAQDIADIQQRVSLVQNAPGTSPTEAAQAATTGDQDILAIQTKLNADLDKLQKDLNAQTLRNVKDGAEQLQAQRQKILEDQKAFTAAVFAEIEQTAAVDLGKLDIQYQKLRGAILANDKLTLAGREAALAQLNRIHDKTVLSAEVQKLQVQFDEIKKLFLLGLKTEQEFIEAKAKLDEGIANLGAKDIFPDKTRLSSAGASQTQSIISAQLGKAFGFKDKPEEQALLGDVIAQSFQVANQAMQAYFDAENVRIQQSLDLGLQRIEVEKDQATARAQSQAEIDSINKQAAAKETALRRAAGEQFKKAKLAEAKISLATELANIAVAAASNPLNGVTFGAAGAIMYGILAALALARYALNVSSISRQQFARGGEVPSKGGRFGGKSHGQGGTKFGFKGREYEAEVDELAVIRTRNAPKNKTYTITGTQTQIASAINKVGGGDDFAPGAVVTERKRTIVDRIFNRGGKISEEKSKKDSSEVHRVYEDERKTSIIKSESITSIFSKEARDKRDESIIQVVDRVISENKKIVERQDRDSIIHLTTERLFTRREEVTKETMEKITRIVSERMDTEANKIYKTTGTISQIVTKLDRHGRESFAFGGKPGEVPIQGGKFGGHPHSEGGTDFHFKGRDYNAEVEELAIIRTKGAPKGKRYTLTGTTMEIASKINQLGGGKAFAPGARVVEKFQSGGIIGSNLEAPVFVSGGGAGSEALLSEVKKLNDKITAQTAATQGAIAATNGRIDRLKVIAVAQDVTNQQNKDLKKTQVGTL